MRLYEILSKVTSYYDKCHILIRELRILSKDILFDDNNHRNFRNCDNSGTLTSFLFNQYVTRIFPATYASLYRIWINLFVL